jgi:hypothetical protein
MENYDACSYVDTTATGEDICSCSRSCETMTYTSKCWTDGTASTCDCFASTENVKPEPMHWVGSCQADATPSCTIRVEKSCCNQFFNL